MPTTIDLTATPLNVSALLDPGCYLAQAQAPRVFYGDFEPGVTPTDRFGDGFFAAADGDYFTVNVGASYAPVWVAASDLGGGARLVLRQAGS